MTYTTRHTQDGDEILMGHNGGLGLASISICFMRGAGHDAIPGTTSLSCSHLERGTGVLDRLAFESALDAIGATLSISVMRRAVRFSVSALEALMPAACELLAEVIESPNGDDDELTILRSEIEDGIVDDLETTSGAEGRATHLTLGGADSARLPIDGLLKTRAAIDDAALEAQRREMFAAPAICAVCANDLEAAEQLLLRVLSRVRHRWGHGPAGLPLDATFVGGREVIVTTCGTGNASLSLYSPAPAMGDPEYVATSLAVFAFGTGFMSPLFHEIRSQRGLSYGVGNRIIERSGAAMYRFSVRPEATRIDECIDAFKQVWRRVADAPPTDDAIEAARTYALGRRAIAFETPSSRLAAALDARLLGLPAEFSTTFTSSLQNMATSQVREHFEGFGPGAGEMSVVAALPEGAARPAGIRASAEIDAELLR